MLDVETTVPRAARLRRDQAAGEFDRQGYLILPGLLGADLMASARGSAASAAGSQWWRDRGCCVYPPSLRLRVA